VDALKAAYSKLIDALALSERDFAPVAAYAGASKIEQGIRSIDVATIGAAVGEFQEAQKLVAQAQSAAAKVSPALAAASRATTDGNTQEFLSVMSLLSARLKEIPLQ